MTALPTHHAPTRPVLRYHGGKFRLRDWIISFFPEHRKYTEPFGGAASVLMAKPRVYAEILGDLDDEIINVFRVLRDRAAAAELKRLLELTPFSRVEFQEAYEWTDDPIERARRTVIKSFMGFGSNALLRASPSCGMRTKSSTWRGPGFRANSSRSGTTPAHDWMNYSRQIPVFTARLQGVVVETRAAEQVMRDHDAFDCLHYVDPPYVLDTRGDRGKDYRFEMTDQEHVGLAEALHSLKGFVVLSGYPSELYNHLYADWKQVSRTHLADGAKARTEVLYLNPKAAMAARQRSLF